MKRKRIVIDLEGARGDIGKPPMAVNQAAPPEVDNSRRGLARPLLIIGVVLLVFIGGAIGGAYLLWLHYQSTPAYSLALLADAAQRDDIPAIDALFDTDQVTDDFVAQVRQRLPESVSSSITSALPLPLSSVAPVVATKLRPTVHDEFVKELKRLTEPAAGKPFILIALAASHFLDIKQDDKRAQVAVNIHGEQLELTMQPVGDRWRIVGVRDDELAKRIADGVVRSMPSNGTRIEDEIRKQLDKFRHREQ